MIFYSLWPYLVGMICGSKGCCPSWALWVLPFLVVSLGSIGLWGWMNSIVHSEIFYFVLAKSLEKNPQGVTGAMHSPNSFLYFLASSTLLLGVFFFLVVLSIKKPPKNTGSWRVLVKFCVFGR